MDYQLIEHRCLILKKFEKNKIKRKTIRKKKAKKIKNRFKVNKFFYIFLLNLFCFYIKIK